ncbi:uncharacterized protein LOC106718600 [Papilio machaon]|uniref:uncharacterized protein LOC106718600 n=1 Tax=Papilio machaon TaxID=76193 RepID=UPI001E665B8D|nr:uncharacterized protein LOC106718600 [Papilio machaon]
MYYSNNTVKQSNPNDLQSISIGTTSITTSEKTVPTPDPFDDDDDDDDFDDLTPAPSTGGSSVFSLLKLVTGLFPGSSSANIVESMLKMFIKQMMLKSNRRQFVKDNEIVNEEITKLKTLFEKQENEITSVEGEIEDSKENVNVEDNIRNISKENSDSNLDSIEDEDNDSEYDSDEPLGGGDGGGGGILGLLAGLSGGEDGQSDLGSLLATVSGIVANLSGDGIDLNSLIASGIGLFAGLLSEGEENPGAVIASYLLTSLDTITGGGAQNNGAFFGNFLSKLVKGTSAAGDPDSSSEDGNKPMADSGGFVASFIISLLGDMSKSSSGGSSHR